MPRACSRCRPTRRSGADVRDALALDDTLITLKLTPNRADCLSVLGIAREVAAITGAPLDAAGGRRASPVDDRRDAAGARRGPVACPRFVGRVIDGIDAARADARPG